MPTDSCLITIPSFISITSTNSTTPRSRLHDTLSKAHFSPQRRGRGRRVPTSFRGPSRRRVLMQQSRRQALLKGLELFDLAAIAGSLAVGALAYSERTRLHFGDILA